MSKEKKQPLLRAAFLLLLIALSVLLIDILTRINLATPRLNCRELESLEDFPENGPVLLEGGEYGTAEDGHAWYRLRFHWDKEACLYFRIYHNVTLNGSEDALEEAYRDYIVRLKPDAQNGGDFEVVIHSDGRSFRRIDSYVYFGTQEQIYQHTLSAMDFSVFLRGICFTVTLVSLILLLYKPSERYLLWLALLSFFRGQYMRLSSLLGLVTWIPALRFLSQGTAYLVLSELLTAFFQYKIMQTYMPVRFGKLPFLWFAAAAALPVLFLHGQPLGAAAAGMAFFAVLYLCYLLCFLRLSREERGEKTLLLTAWVLTVVLRFFDEFCEVGALPSGDVNLRFRLRGLVSLLFVVAFFVVVAKRFAQKFQEADELNVHLEERIREKTRRQTLFVRSMLHNLKTPLFSLSGYSDMALSSLEKNPAQARQYMEKAREKALFAGELMDHIFLVTQMDADMVHLQMAPVNLGHLLAAVADTPTAGQEGKRIALTLKLPENIFLPGDQLYLRQAFQNILDNARVHTPDGGAIALTLQGGESGAEVHIRDNGCGIAPEEQERIFDAYYSNRHGRQQSSGLGLYIASEIVKRHGGSISVQSEPGQGADFCIRLPYSPEAEASEKI